MFTVLEHETDNVNFRKSIQEQKLFPNFTARLAALGRADANRKGPSSVAQLGLCRSSSDRRHSNQQSKPFREWLHANFPSEGDASFQIEMDCIAAESKLIYEYTCVHPLTPKKCHYWRTIFKLYCTNTVSCFCAGLKFSVSGMCEFRYNTESGIRVIDCILFSKEARSLNPKRMCVFLLKNPIMTSAKPHGIYRITSDLTSSDLSTKAFI